MDASSAFSQLPIGLREELVAEYRQIIKNFAERRWSASELSAGRFCEIVYSILDGRAKSLFPLKASKPNDFVASCRKLESNSHQPRSFQILIPRMLPALYEVRNNRGVGHVGGDVDPNYMDATAVVSMCNWIMGELVRVLHSTSTEDAQALVDSLSGRHVPLVWQIGEEKKILDPSLSLKEQILVLLASHPGPVEIETLRVWTMYKNKSYFRALIKKLSDDRLVHVDQNQVEILPPGSNAAEDIIAVHDAKLSAI